MYLVTHDDHILPYERCHNIFRNLINEFIFVHRMEKAVVVVNGSSLLSFCFVIVNVIKVECV